MKKASALCLSLLAALSLFAQGAPTFYERIAASTVFLVHTIYMDPALCKNPEVVRRWESNNDIKILSMHIPLSSGSGFLVSDGTLILTNRHVVEFEDLGKIREPLAALILKAFESSNQKGLTWTELSQIRTDLAAMINRGAYRFIVEVGDKKYADSEQVAKARENEADIAVLRLKESAGPGLPLATTESITTAIVGREVFSFGYPLGYGLDGMFEENVATMNKGNVSALRKADLGIQHSAAISHGNSGGPLVDASGTVIGMNTAGSEEGNSLFFAVGADRIRDFLSRRGIALTEPEKPNLAQPATPSGISANAAGELEVSEMVLVESEKGARVIVDGKDVGPVPQLVTITAPLTSLQVSTENGAFSARLRLVSTLRGTTVLRADLVKTGSLVITSNEDLVRVIIDGNELGEFKGGLFRGLTVGDHKVELVGKDLYGSGTARVVEEITSQVHIEVFPAGRLRVKVPADVLVSLSGKGYSTRIAGGARDLTLPEGEYEARAEGGEYYPASSTIRIRKGETAIWEPYVSGMLAFTVTPAGASLLIPGRDPILTEKEAQDIPPGTYKAVLRKPGYRDREVTLTVTAGRRTEVSETLEELARGVLILPRLACPVTLRFNDREVPGAVSPDKSLRFEGIPAGYPLDITFHSTAAASGSLDIPARKVSLKEGETMRLEIPSGSFTLPWVPAGAVVEIGKDPALELPGEGGLEYRSPPLPPGRFPVRIRGGALGDGVAVDVAIAPDGTSDPRALREALSGALSEAKARDEGALTRRKKKTRIGYASLGAGALGAAGAVTSFILGSQAMDAYRAATTTAEAIERRKVVETWQALLFTSSGIGLAGLGLTPVFLLGKPPAGELEKSIRALEEGIKVLSK